MPLHTGKLEEIIEHRTAVNLVDRLKWEFGFCVENKNLKNARTVAREMVAALDDLIRINEAREEAAKCRQMEIECLAEKVEAIALLPSFSIDVSNAGKHPHFGRSI